MKVLWRRTLESLLAEGSLPITAIPSSIRKDLEQWGFRTGTLELVRQGRGARLRVVNADHFRALTRKEFPEMDFEAIEAGPGRIHNLAYVRDTKAGETRLDTQYLLGKVIGAQSVCIESAAQPIDLAKLTENLGCFALPISETFPAWKCDSPILLVENQTLFDRVGWLAPDWRGILFHYAGNLSELYLQWLSRSEFQSVTLFPDYDGIGLRNYSRLVDAIPIARWHWESDWEMALEKFGNSDLWNKERQRNEFETLWQRWENKGWPDPTLRSLMQSMRSRGRMLEQEWVLVGQSLP